MPLSSRNMEVPLPYCVYVLRSECDGDLYIGFTQDLTQRLAEHNAGKSPATAPRRPFVLLFCECFATKSEATAREKYLKTTKGHRALRLMLRGCFWPSNHGDQQLMTSASLRTTPHKWHIRFQKLSVRGAKLG